MRRVAMLALGLVVLSACGGGGDGQLSASELRSKLLNTSDLPEGYTVDAEEEDVGTPDFCDGRFNPESLSAEAQVEIDFERLVDDIPVNAASQFLAQFESEAAAEEAMAEVKTAAEECGTFEQTTDDGTTIAGEVAPASFPDMGDQTFALDLTAEVAAGGQEVPIGAEIVFVRDGSILMGIFNGALGDDPDSDLTVDMVGEGLAKLA